MKSSMNISISLPMALVAELKTLARKRAAEDNTPVTVSSLIAEALCRVYPELASASTIPQQEAKNEGI